jgi:hypothetical protein
MSAWLGSYRQIHANAKTAKTAKKPDAATVAGQRAYTPADGHMPRGYGKCRHCGEYGWLPAGPVDVECEQCAVDRLFSAAARATNPALAADPAEHMLRGEVEQ